MFTEQDRVFHDTYYVVYHWHYPAIIAILVTLLFLARNIVVLLRTGAAGDMALPDLEKQVKAAQKRITGRNVALILAGLALFPGMGSYPVIVIVAAGIFTAVMDGLVVMFSESPEASIRYWIYAAAMLGVVMLVLA